MNSLVDVQELARRFNEDEAVWRCFVRKRAWRERHNSRSRFTEHVLDYLDYLAAELEHDSELCAIWESLQPLLAPPEPPPRRIKSFNPDDEGSN